MVKPKKENYELGEYNPESNDLDYGADINEIYNNTVKGTDKYLAHLKSEFTQALKALPNSVTVALNTIFLESQNGSDIDIDFDEDSISVKDLPKKPDTSIDTDQLATFIFKRIATFIILDFFEGNEDHHFDQRQFLMQMKMNGEKQDIPELTKKIPDNFMLLVNKIYIMHDLKASLNLEEKALDKKQALKNFGKKLDTEAPLLNQRRDNAFIQFLKDLGAKRLAEGLQKYVIENSFFKVKGKEFVKETNQKLDPIKSPSLKKE